MKLIITRNVPTADNLGVTANTHTCYIRQGQSQQGPEKALSIAA